MLKKNIAAISIIVVLAGVNAFLFFKKDKDQNLIASLTREETLKDQYETYVLPISQPNYIPFLNSDIDEPRINAKSAAVFDTRSSRFLYEKEPESRLPIASLTKIMTAVVALEIFNSDDIITITEDSLRVDGERQDLYLGERISVRNILKLMLIESSNDAAYALTSHARSRGIDLIKAMNDKALFLGMNDTKFLDSAGLDDRGYSTVYDLVRLVEYSLNYPEIWDISAEKSAIVESIDSKIKHNITSTNRLLGLVSDIIGGKTGKTEGALECLILITAVSNFPTKIVSIVLGSNDRFGDTRNLIDWTRRAYRWQ